MTKASAQTFILAPPMASGLSLSLALESGADAHETLRGLAAGFDPHWGMVGIGEPLAGGSGHLDAVEGGGFFAGLLGGGGAEHFLLIALASGEAMAELIGMGLHLRA